MSNSRSPAMGLLPSHEIPPKNCEQCSERTERTSPGSMTSKFFRPSRWQTRRPSCWVLVSLRRVIPGGSMAGRTRQSVLGWSMGELQLHQLFVCGREMDLRIPTSLALAISNFSAMFNLFLTNFGWIVRPDPIRSTASPCSGVKSYGRRGAIFGRTAPFFLAIAEY